MKKKVITTVCILLSALLLIPIPLRLRDGGTVKYQAVLYSVSDGIVSLLQKKMFL